MVKKEELLKALEEKTGSEWRIETVKRADNTQYTGVMKLSERDEKGTIISPILPVELDRVEDMEAFATAIIQSYDEMLESCQDMINSMRISAKDIPKEWLRPILINRVRNKEFLAETPYEEYLDLALVVKAFIPYDDSDKSCSITINEGIAEAMGLTMDEAFSIAKENALALGAYYTRLTPPDDVYIPDDVMFPCTSKLGNDSYSARILYYPEILKPLIGDWECYILPYSTAELFLADKASTPICAVREVLALMNKDVPKSDYLSHNIYELDKETGKIRIVEE